MRGVFARWFQVDRSERVGPHSLELVRKGVLGFVAASLFGSAFSFGADSVWVSVPAGKYIPLFGSKERAEVVVDAFELQRHPVTNEDYLKFVKGASKWRRSRAQKVFIDSSYLKDWQADLELGKKVLARGPVTLVSWYAANAYCESIGARLPTVNEWEYAAMQPIDGHEIKKIILDWYSRPNPDVLPSVDSGLSNRWGIAAMHGLIWEWTLDYSSAIGTGESRGGDSLDKSLFCGSGSAGSSDSADYAAFLRFGMRSSLKSNYSVGNLGFRCARETGAGIGKGA